MIIQMNMCKINLCKDLLEDCPVMLLIFYLGQSQGLLSTKIKAKMYSVRLKAKLVEYIFWR